MKICRVCKDEKPNNRFGVYSNGVLHGQCKDCTNLYLQKRSAAIESGTWVPTSAKPSEPYQTAPSATKTPTTEDLYWCAGFIEAEGSFDGTNSLRVSASQKEPELLIRLQEFFGGSVRLRANDKHPTHEWYIYGPRAHGVMLTLYSILSIKRQNQIRRALNKPPVPDFIIAETISTVVVETDEKICTSCSLTKKLEEFPKAKSGNHINECQECKKRYLKARYEGLKSGTWNPGKKGKTGIKDFTPRPTLTPNTNDISWAAGFLDGEATFRFKSSYEIRCPQVNQEPLYRLQALFGGSIRSSSKISHWALYGESARELTTKIFPLLSQKRQEQVQQTI